MKSVKEILFREEFHPKPQNESSLHRGLHLLHKMFNIYLKQMQELRINLPSLMQAIT